MNQEETSSSKNVCFHCGLDCISPIYDSDDDGEDLIFCCQGCRSVYRLLNSLGLDQFYQIKETGDNIRGPSPVQVDDAKLSFLDSKEFLEQYSWTDNDGNLVMDFYLEGVHCLACLWLIEKIPEIVMGVRSCHLNLAESIATVVISDGGKFSKVAHQLNLLGYRPHPLQNQSEAKNIGLQENRAMLIKIGVAGACAGNIMILAISLYAGVDGVLEELFRWGTFLLSLPILLFSAIPFYKSAYSGIKSRNISIDIPIVFAVILGSLSGLYNLLTGAADIYFDSLGILIFLLLSARYVLKKVQQKGLNAQEVGLFFSSGITHRKNVHSGIFEETHAKFLKAGDFIKILAGEVIPADGVVKVGDGHINTSLLTGESIPQKVNVNSNIYSGTVNLDSELIVEVMKVDRETRVGQILSDVERSSMHKAPIARFSDKVASYFVTVVFSLAFISFFIFFYYINVETAFNRALTLIIITCPCALGLATPLALTAALSRLKRKGMIVKGEDVLEKLSHTKNIFLDKTGTLTFGHFKVISWDNYIEIPQLKSIVYVLEKKSKHPLAKALVQFLEENHHKEIDESSNLVINDYEEILASGVQASINNQLISIKAYEETGPEEEKNSFNHVGIFVNEKLVAKIVFEDLLRPESAPALKQLRGLGLKTYLVSGDRQDTVDVISSKLDIPSQQVWAKKTPEDKFEILKEYPYSIMVGDGANDALALGHAFIGVAVQGSVEVSLRAADVYLTTPGVGPIVELIEISKESMKVIYRNLIFSLFYNIIGTVLALLGYVDPLLAAILMPISSLTVVLSTIWGTMKLRES